jgi:hypothetical protein
VTVEWDDDDGADMILDPWLMPGWPDLTGAEVAALAVRVQAAVDALPPADRLVAGLALRAGRTAARFDWPPAYDPDEFDRVDVVASVGDVDLVRVSRSALAGWRRYE